MIRRLQPPDEPARDASLGRGWPVVVLAAAAGAALFAAAFVVWPLIFVAPVPLAWLAVAAPPRRAMAAVLVTQLVMWLWVDRWLIDVTVVGWPLLAFYMSLWAAAFVAITGWLARRPPLGRVPLALVVPVVWVALECLRGELVFDGYPWYLAAHPVVEWPVLAQSADLLGAYFVSFLVLSVAGLAADALPAGRHRLTRRALAGAAAVVAAAQVANLAYGGWRLAQRAPLADGPVVLAVQTNMPQSNKIRWTPDQQVEDLAALIEQTADAFDRAVESGRRPDLVAWPETMAPGFGLDPASIRTVVESGYFPGDAFSDAIERLAQRLGVPLLVGSASFEGLRAGETEWLWDAHHNSAYLVTGDPPYQRYDKFFLTPFGETMPYISWWPWLEQRLLALGADGMRFDLDASDELRRLELEAGGRTLVIGTPICFEDTVPAVCRRMVGAPDGGADILIGLANDGWFGRNDAGRAHHAQIARYRCIENRVPMVRAVNTGVSVAIDSAGRVIGSIGSGRYGTARQAGALVAELTLDSRGTLYSRVGEAWGWLCVLAVAAAGAWTVMMRRRQQRGSGRGAAPIVLGALAVLWGCRISDTGEQWSTKAMSSPTMRAENMTLEAQAEDAGMSPSQRAMGILIRAAVAPEPLLRANAIEGLHHAHDFPGDVVTRGLIDDNRGVRFVAAMTIGQLEMSDVAHLLEPLLADDSESVRAAAIYGMRECGLPADPTPLAEMIRSTDPEVRGNAALVLGKLGNASAIPMIRAAATVPMDRRVSEARAKMVDLQLAEAMVQLGDQGEIDAIRAALFAPAEQGELTALACMMCGRLGDQRAVPNLVRLARRTDEFRQPAEVRMAATWALARLAPTEVTSEIPLSYVADPKYQLRVQAALTLGEIGDRAALGTLERLLSDESPLVQVAAASAILQLERNAPSNGQGGTEDAVDTNPA